MDEHEFYGQRAPSMRWLDARWFKWAAAVVVIVLLLIAAQLTGPGSADAAGAHGVCREFMADTLKAPATATFATLDDSSVTHRGGDRWTVRSHVDAENSFAANIRTRFTCTVTWQDDGSWRLEELEPA